MKILVTRFVVKRIVVLSIAIYTDRKKKTKESIMKAKTKLVI